MSAPTVAELDVGSGPAGTQVLITGTGFDGATGVAFGAVSVGTQFAVVSETQVVAYVPAGAAGTVHVRVTTPEGTSAESSADQFTVDEYVGPAGGGGGSAPTVTGVDPDTATDNDGGETITVTGTGFTTAIAVRFGVDAASPQGSFTVVSDTQLSVVTPAGDGTVDVVVTNSYGESATSSADEYTYPDADPPVLSSIAPTGGYYGYRFVLTGSGFDDATGVYFGDEPAPFTAVSDTEIDGYVPEGSGTVDVIVVGPGGSSSAVSFAYGSGGLPRTTASENVAPSGYEGWTQGEQTVTLYPAAAGGYGIAKTYYILDAGGLTEYSGPFVVSAAGSHQLQYWSVDVRGNQEPVNVGWINILSASTVPTGLAVTPLIDAVVAQWDQIVSMTGVTYRLYRGVSAEVVTELVASTSANIVSIAQPASDGAYYYAVSSIDTAGVESALSDPVGPVTASVVDVPDGSLGITKFASGIVPPRVVTSLPVLPDAAYPAGSLAFLTTDAKLYRTATGAADSWVNVVNAGDLSGTISAAQLAAAAVTAEKIASGAVTATKIADAIHMLQDVDELPALPADDYPAGTLVYVPEEGALYRCEEAVDLVPVMTSNTTPSGEASASSELDASHAAWKAFDDAAGGWQSTTGDGTPWTLEYEFAAARVITWYSLKGCAADLTLSPASWTFEAYDESTASWVVLDTRSGVSGWAAGTLQAFSADNETSYTRYRLNISAVAGGSSCGVDELQMAGWMESAPTLITNADVAADAAIAQSKLALAVTDAEVASDAAIALSKLNLTGLAVVPSGVICMWSGAVDAVPDGWYLCNGSNGTPDLRDRFVVGAGSTYAKGATGGETTHTLTAGEMPGHTHSLPIYALTPGAGSAAGVAVKGGTGTPEYNYGTSGSSGSGNAHENRPPYYALAFIMKG